MKKALPAISVITFLGFLDTHLLIPVIALYASELGAGIGTVGIIIGLYSIANTPANVFFGRLVDRFGYKRPLVLGLAGDAIGMFLYSLCRLPVHLALVRVLHGLSGGVVGPSTMAAIAEYGGEERRGRSMAFYGISLASATLVGYGLSGFIASGLGYEFVFWLGAALLCVGIVISLALPRSRRRSTPGAEPSGDVWKRVKTLLKRKGLVAPYCAIFAQYFTFGGVVTLLPLYVKGHGMEAMHVGMLLAVFAVMFIILQLPVGGYSDRKGRLTPAIAGMALGIVALLLMPAVTAFPLLLVVMAAYGTAYGTIFPSVSAMVAEQAPAEEHGLAMGIFHALLTAGVAVGAPVIGWAGECLGVEAGLLLSAAAMVIALGVAVFFRKSV